MAYIPSTKTARVLSERASPRLGSTLQWTEEDMFSAIRTVRGRLGLPVLGLVLAIATLGSLMAQSPEGESGHDHGQHDHRHDDLRIRASDFTSDDPRSAHSEAKHGSGDIASRRVGDVTFRLTDVAVDILVAAGLSTERGESLRRIQGGGHDPRKRGFTLQNVELAVAGEIDPYVSARLHVIYFIDPAEGESVFELEEAFALSKALPGGVEVEAGQMYTEFGIVNPQHPHQWDFLAQPIINTRVFGPDGMRAPGVRVGVPAPLPWTSWFHFGLQDATGEAMASFAANDEFFEERAIGGRPFVEREVRSPKDLVMLLRWDHRGAWVESGEWGWTLGGSALFGPNATGRDGRTTVWGIDFGVDWTPQSAESSVRWVRWQSEAIFRDYRADDYFDAGDDPVDPSDDTVFASDTLRDRGAYTQLMVGLSDEFSVGARYEWLGGKGASAGGREQDPFRDDRQRLSGLLAWQPSESLRLRLQYDYDDTQHLDDTTAHSVWFGAEFLFGSLPDHQH